MQRALVAFVIGVCAVAALVGDAGGGVAASPVSARSCFPLGSSGPGFDASIDNSADNATVCVTVGERLLVLLRAQGPSAPSWGPIRVSRPGFVGAAPLTLMLPRGVVAGNFSALKPGRVLLSSQRRICPIGTPGSVTCQAIQQWRTTLVITGSRSVSDMAIVFGRVTQAPTCPVERKGHPCAPAPVVGNLQLRNARQMTVVSARIDIAGNFRVRVRRGRYEVVVETGHLFPRCPSRFVDVDAARVRNDVLCDTGIR